MSLTEINSILEQLSRIQEHPICIVCLNKCNEPVRIKICGHYFCRKCLKSKRERVCPNCKAVYEERELEHDNIAKETDYLLSELKKCLLESKYYLETKKPKNAKDQGKRNVYKTEGDDDSDKDVVRRTSRNYKPLKNDQKLMENTVDAFTFEYCKRKYQVKFFDELYNKTNVKGETPLHIACKKKKIEEVNELLRKNIDINAEDFAGWAPLHEAVQSGSAQIVETLLNHGALINIPGGEYTTPLHKAIAQENETITRLLLKYGADKRAVDYFGKRPVEYAINDALVNIFTEEFKCVDRVEQLTCSKKIVAFCYYIEKEYKQKLIAKQVKIEEEYNVTKVTHFFIRKTHKTSLKILLAMLDGCTILPQEWIDDNFLQNLYFVPIPSYTFIHNAQLNDGIRRAAINTLLKLPKLFDGFFFFIQGHKNSVKICNINVSVDALTSLIISGGGKVLHRAPTPRTCERFSNFPYHANNSDSSSKCCHYVIYEEDNPPILQYHMQELKHKSSKWLIDCAVNFAIND